MCLYRLLHFLFLFALFIPLSLACDKGAIKELKYPVVISNESMAPKTIYFYSLKGNTDKRLNCEPSSKDLSAKDSQKLTITCPVHCYQGKWLANILYSTEPKNTYYESWEPYVCPNGFLRDNFGDSADC